MSGQPGGDPAAVAYDALGAARARGTDVVLVDTAGRLHTHGGLMKQLAKVERVIRARHDGAPHETLLVLDATVGQNGLVQAREFSKFVTVTGIVLAKMDSTARGGIVVALREELGIPVRLVGVGEGLDDLEPFRSGRLRPGGAGRAMSLTQLDKPVQFLKGVGPRRAETLARMGILTARDLLYHVPRRYDDASTITPLARVEVGMDVTAVGEVRNKGVVPTRSGLRIFQAVIKDDNRDHHLRLARATVARPGSAGGRPDPGLRPGEVLPRPPDPAPRSTRCWSGRQPSPSPTQPPPIPTHPPPIPTYPPPAPTQPHTVRSSSPIPRPSTSPSGSSGA